MSNLGRKIYGFCNGKFGRDDYDSKIIIAEGEGWIVCKYLDEHSGRTAFAEFIDDNEKAEYLSEWTKRDEEY